MSGAFSPADRAHYASYYQPGPENAARLNAALQQAAQRVAAAREMNDATALAAWTNRFNAILANPAAAGMRAPGIAVFGDRLGLPAGQFPTYLAVPAGGSSEPLMLMIAQRRDEALAGGQAPLILTAGTGASVVPLYRPPDSEDPPLYYGRNDFSRPRSRRRSDGHRAPQFNFANNQSSYAVQIGPQRRAGILTIDAEGRWSVSEGEPSRRTSLASFGAPPPSRPVASGQLPISDGVVSPNYRFHPGVRIDGPVAVVGRGPGRVGFRYTRIGQTDVYQEQHWRPNDEIPAAERANWQPFGPHSSVRAGGRWRVVQLGASWVLVRVQQ